MRCPESQSGECQEGSQDQGKIFGSRNRRAPTNYHQLASLALVAMVKSSDLRNRHDAPVFWFLHYSRLWCVLA